MGRLRILVALGLVLVLASGSYAKNKGKKAKHAPRGTVETVNADSVVVKVQQGKKKDGETVDQTFQLNSETKFEIVTVSKHAKGEKPTKETSPATLSDLKAGARVQIPEADGSTAKKISIIKHAKGGKKSSA